LCAPAPFQDTHFWIDIQAPNDQLSDAKNELKGLAELCTALASCGIYATVCLPDVYREAIPAVDRSRYSIRDLNWTKDGLKKLLANRMRAADWWLDDQKTNQPAKPEGIWDLVDYNELEPHYAFDEALIRAAGNNPGEMIALGNRLLMRCGELDRPLTRAEFESIVPL